MSTLITIMAHGDYSAQQCFDRHLPFWRSHGLPITVMCPEDSEVRTGLPMIKIGTKQHHGPIANGRFRMLLKTLMLTEHDEFVIFEYDSFCLTPELPIISDGVYGISFIDTRQIRDSGYRDGCVFEGTLFIHPPLMFNRATIGRVVGALDTLGDHCECGLWDRYLGLACQRYDIPVNCLREGGLAYSENTIGRDYGLGPACEAAINGAIYWHGVKSEITLNAILDSRLAVA